MNNYNNYDDNDNDIDENSEIILINFFYFS